MLADPEPLPAFTLVGAGKDFARRAGQHRLAVAGRADRHVMDVGIVEPAGDPSPGFAAIEAAPHAVDLDPRPDDMVVGGVDGQRRHPRDSDIRAILDHVDGQLPPLPPAIGRAEQGRGPCAGKDRVWVARIERDLPHIHLVHRRVEMLKAHPAVEALVDAVIGAGEDGTRLARMHREAVDAAFAPQPAADTLPAVAAVGAGPGAAADGADAERDVAGHVPLSQPVWEMSMTTPSGPAHFISKLRWLPAAISMSRPSFEVSCSPDACSSLSAAP